VGADASHRSVPAGALIVASITGRKWGPDGEEALGALEAHVDVPRSVRDVLRRATATDPDTRFPSVAALLQTLDRAIGGESSLAGLGVRPVTPAHETDPATAAAQQEARLRAATGLDYELMERLGHGASGAVWKARDLALNREVALKALHPEIAQDPRAVSACAAKPDSWPRSPTRASSRCWVRRSAREWRTSRCR
jgi:hypothetical protein